MLRTAARDLSRLRRIAQVLARFGFRELLRKEPTLADGDLPPTDADLAEQSSPRRFRLMLEELGPTFIKLGQVLSSRPDLVAAPYVAELAQLQDHCEPLPFAVIRAALTESLGAPPEALFAQLDEEPLATASIAQVHAGRTKDGERVVVKVQRPGIEDEIRVDLDVLYRVAWVLEMVFEEGQAVDPIGVVEAFDKGLKEELNFRHEASNCHQFAKFHRARPDIEVPRVIDDLSSSTVLTMSRLDGVPFSRLPPDADRSALGRRLVKEALDQVFLDGLFHADPHPGNLLYLGPGRIGVLDFGLIGQLTRQMQETLVVLALAVAVKDPDSVARTLYRLGQAEERVDIVAVRDEVAALFERYMGRAIGGVDARTMAQELLSLAVRHKIRMPRDYVLLGRAATTLEGLVRELVPDLDVTTIAKPYAERLMKDRVAPENLQDGLFRALLQLDGMSQDLPLQVSQIVSDLSSNRFGVRVSGRALERISDSLLTAGSTVAAAIVGGAFIIGSFIGLARVDWTIGGVPLVGIVGALVGLSLVFWLAAYLLVRPRLKRLSLVRMIWGKR